MKANYTRAMGLGLGLIILTLTGCVEYDGHYRHEREEWHHRDHDGFERGRGYYYHPGASRGYDHYDPMAGIDG